MEAAAASTDEAPLIAPANGTVKKKFRARKTMTASCRQQLASLKLKNSLKNEKTGKDSPNRSAQQPELICETNFTAQDDPAAKINKSQGVFPNGLKVSIEVSQVDSEINIGCSYNETWDGISKKSEDVPFSHTAHFVVRDFNGVASENHIAGLEPDASPTNTGSQVLSEDTLQIAESSQGVDAECELENVECSDISENLNASITLKIIDEGESFKETSSADVVAPPGPTDTDTAAASRNELDPSHCTTDGSNALASPPTVTANSHSVQPEGDAAGGVCKKKRTCSESSDIPQAKRAKTSNSVLLDEIQCLIDRRINILFEGLFDERMQTLTRQADLVRRNGNHIDDVARHLRIIRKLERRLKYAVHLQGQLGTCSSTLTPAHSSSEELQNTDTEPNTVVPPAEASESRPRTPSAPNPSSSDMDLVVLSDNESEEPSHQEQCRAERPSSASKKMDSAAMQKIMESIKEHRKKAHSSRTVKTVIDLTDDEEQRCDKEANVDKNLTLPGEISSQGQSEEESVIDHQMVTDHSASAPLSEGNVGVENVFDKYSVKNDLALRNHNGASSSYDVNEIKTSTPKSPQSENLQESAVKQKTDPANLKPPQKPQLRLAQVQNPKGIALSWNITTVDPSCAPAKSYCLYVHQGDPNNPKKLWKKIGEIKALPLPMACTLTQFVEDTTYSFAMRAKDGSGRFGPLCDIQSTTLKPQKLP